MHCILDELQGIIREVANGLVAHGIIYNNDVHFAVELAKNPKHGHFATNIAFVLARASRKESMEIAGLFANKLTQHRFFIKAESAHPGFVNMFLTAEFLSKAVDLVNMQGNDYGATNHGHNEPINVEFVSANPTGPMHIGHARGAVLGDVLANLFKKLGYQVIKEFYINDAGSQIVQLAHSVYVRYLELLGQDISQMEFAYPGLYVIDIAAAVFEQYGTALVDTIETERYEILSEIAVNKMMQLIKQDLLILGINHDVFVSEKALRCEGRVERAVNFLQQHNLVYKGTMEAPKGKASEDWHPHEQLVFKATLFGDSTDRSLQKADGEWTYFAADIAYHFYKYERGFRKMFVSLGKDHDGYAKRIRAAVSALSNNQAELKVLLYDIVRFFDNGIAVKMSKRSGQILRINDVVEEVGCDITRFNLVSIDSKQVLDFDFQRVKEQSKDNQLFYIQYAHARCCSVIAMIEKAFPGMLAANGKAFMLSSQEESGMICLLALWPNVIFTAAQKQELHHICTYLYQVASAWHATWHAGKKDGSLRFLIADNQELTNARLALVCAVRHLLCSGLNILGIEPLDSM